MGFGHTSWTWPSCNHPRTLSFRAGVDDRYGQGLANDEVSISFFDEENLAAALPWEDEEDQVVNSIMRTVGSSKLTQKRRLFFDPSADSSSLLLPVENPQPNSAESSSRKQYRKQDAAFLGEITEVDGATVPFKGGGVAVAVSSADPYADFRKSMEEMIVAHGWMGWDWLQDMLEWYLQANGFISNNTVQSDTIVRAFVDMLKDQDFSVSSDEGDGSASSSSCTSSAPASPASSSSSSLSYSQL